MACITSEGWLEGTENQAMWFGALPVWAQELADDLPLSLWPEQVNVAVHMHELNHFSLQNDFTLYMQISGRQPNFNQMIVNMYQPGEGISSHVDLLKFEDGIAIISLGSPATMTFTKIDTSVTKGLPPFQPEALWPNRPTGAYSKTSLPAGSCLGNNLQQNVYLQAGDLLLLQGDARYRWKHGIAFNQACSLQYLKKRISITLRRLVQN